MSDLLKEVQKRRLVELSIKEGRRLQSLRTKWIHTCYEEESLETIPTYENTCFILALFRSKVGNQIQEAKELLEHLLHFQVPSGNFPVYLHEYPQAKNRNLALHLLVPLFWIRHYFQSILEKPLRNKLDAALAFLHQFCVRSNQERPFPPSLAAKLHGFEQKLTRHAAAETTIDWANVMMAYQMMEKEAVILPQALRHWNQKLQAFSGDPLNEFQRGLVKETSLFDLFMAEATGRYCDRILDPHLVHLHAAVIFPIKGKGEGEGKDSDWLLKIVEGEPAYQKGFHRLRLLWGEHSFVCQERNLKVEAYSENQLLFTYPEQLPHEKESGELSFYVDHQNDVSLFINGEKGTLFQLGDEVKIMTSTKALILHFSLNEGEGIFCGHISRGNRPSQLLPHRFEAYDWKITIRTVQRTDRIKIGLSLDVL